MQLKILLIIVPVPEYKPNLDNLIISFDLYSNAQSYKYKDLYTCLFVNFEQSNLLYESILYALRINICIIFWVINLPAFLILIPPEKKKYYLFQNTKEDKQMYGKIS